MKKLRILQTPVRFYPYIGGVEYHVYYLSEQLVKFGYEVSVVCANEPRGEKNEMVNGVAVKRLNYQFKIANTNISFGFPRALWKENFDIGHTHMPTPWTADWTVLIAKLRGKKSILTVHNDMDKPSLIGKLITWMYLHTLFRLTLRLVDRVVIVNSEWKTAFKKTVHLFERMGKKVVTIPNAINTELFKPAQVKTTKNIILFVSILDEYHRFKGFDYLLDAMPEIRRKVPDANLIVVGAGVLVDEYQQKARELGLENAVQFHGKKTQDELVSYYQNAKVFVLPSIEIEGFGLVLLEAMSCKVPIVATDIVGLAKEIKAYNAGRIIPVRDVGAISTAVLDILSDSRLCEEMGNNGGQIAEKYSWHNVAKNISQLYIELTI